MSVTPSQLWSFGQVGSSPWFSDQLLYVSWIHLPSILPCSCSHVKLLQVNWVHQQQILLILVFLVNCFMSGLSPWPLALSCSTSVVHLPLVHFSTSVALRQLSSISPLVLVSSCVLLNVSWVHGPAWSLVLIFACTVCSSPLVLVLRVECAQSRPIG